jgi:chromosome segregation protein
VEDAELCVQNEIEHASRLKQMLDELAEINHDLGEQLRSKEDSILTMKTTEEHLSTLLQSSHERNDRLEAQRDVKSESSQRVQELERKLEEKQQLLSSLQNEFDALKIAHKTATMELQRCRDESSTHLETKRKLDELTLLVRAKESEFEELKANREKMLLVISTLERELEQLRNERKSLASKMSNLDKTETDADEAREMLSSLEMKVKDLQVQLDKAQEDSRDANDKLHEQESTVSQLEEALEKAQEDSKAAWMHVRELEGLSQVGKSMENSIKAKLARVEKKLATRDEQLDESRKGIAEAQKMIYRLMETVKVLRKSGKDQELDHTNLDFVVASE